jgi:hypothetical protein
MVAQIENLVISSGMTVLNSAVTMLTICAAEPTTFAIATSNVAANMVGSWSAGASNVFGAPVSIANGMSVASNSATTGTITNTGTASWWAAVSAASLYAHGSLASVQGVTSGNSFTLASFAITVPAH